MTWLALMLAFCAPALLMIAPLGFRAGALAYKSADLEADSTQRYHRDYSAGELFDAETMTWEGWVKFETTSAARQFAMQYYTGGTVGWRFMWDSAGQLALTYYDSTGGDHQVLQVAWSPSTATWYHIAVTWEYTGTYMTAKFYRNGSQLGSTQTAPAESGTITEGTTPFYLGGGGYKMDGKMCEWRAWNVVRTVTEINDNKSTRLTSGTGLLACWPLDGDCEDATSANLDLTPENTPTYSTDGPF